VRPSKLITDFMTNWRSKDGLTAASIKSTINSEFNKFRGLFPLKLFITGPPGAGKTYFCEALARDYGIPHIKVQDAIDLGISL